jgi:hypothetical protein
MANRRRREDWQRRAQQVRDICADRTLALWQKAHLVGAACKDVQLDGLQSKHRHKIFAGLAKINIILARYPIETFDDYALIDSEDLHTIINTFKAYGAMNI